MSRSPSASLSSSPDLLASDLATLTSAGPTLTPDPAPSLSAGLAATATASLVRVKPNALQDRLTDYLREQGTLETSLATENLDREKYGRRQSGSDSAREKAKWATKRLEAEASLDRNQVRLREVEEEIRRLRGNMAANKDGGRNVQADSTFKHKSARRPNFSSNAIVMRLMGGLALCAHRIGEAFSGMFGTLDEDEQKRLLEERTRSRERQDDWSLIASKGGPSPTPELEMSLSRHADADAGNPFNQDANPFAKPRDSHRTGGLAPRR